ncbi:unnamed protein product [Cylicocyclus nassatus]|uniref:Chondroitin proteoglycan 4 domain-containing protein n=1 Tax=Cylicocyclus nassatus TaxID=53992 RepID=A0AA36H9C6_CYLNA|nr:unnamed protein product [Cylicocyclus nassatus]
MLIVGIFLTMVTILEARIQEQCHCDSYKKCETKFKPAMSFGKCMHTCKRRVKGDLPKEFVECLSEFDHVLTKTLKCAHEAVGTGCTSNEKNVLNKRNFTLFEELFLKDFHEIGEKVDVFHEFSSKTGENMSRCMLQCFYPAENICTRTMKCGLFMPNELRLLDNLTGCALKSDVSRGIMMEIATCLRSVTKRSKATSDEEDKEDIKS